MSNSSNPSSPSPSADRNYAATTGSNSSLASSASSSSSSSSSSPSSSTNNTRGILSQQVQFIEAVQHGDLSVLQHFLLRTPVVDINGYNVDGQTALHQSCLSGNLELVKLLVQFGADVRLTNRDGWSALHIAAYYGHRDIALYLINASLHYRHSH